MNFLVHLIYLLRSYLSSDFIEYWFFPLIALSFFATVPVIIRKLFL